MKILKYTIAPMYLWSIVLLVILAAFSSIILHQFPYSLIFSVIVCAAIEMLIRAYYLKQKFKIPFSGIITGLIIGCIAPINVGLIPILLVSIIAILSKFFIKVKSNNIFNPASLGLLIGLAVFSVGSSWWATTAFNISGIAISLSIILIIAAYQARRLVLSFSFIITLVMISFLSSSPLSFGNLAIALLSVNFFFVFLMLIEPKTSPATKKAQTVYGVGIAIIYYILVLYTPQTLFWARSIIFMALLMGNLIYAIYRISGQKIIKKVKLGMHLTGA